MNSLVCIKMIIWGYTCSFAHVDSVEPQTFIYGHAHDKEAMVWASRFNVPTPAKGPDIAFRPEHKPQRVVAKVQPKKKALPKRGEYIPDTGDVKTAYAAEGPRGLEKLIDRMFDKGEPKSNIPLYVKADGNEVMGCIEKNKYLMATMRTMRKKWGKSVIVNSAYRSPKHNKRVRGATNSYHMSCRALDVRIQGVGKDTLARWLRSQPGMGGVGIYKSSYVHFDDGRRRDWDWR